jgi:hypothetical protein
MKRAIRLALIIAASLGLATCYRDHKLEVTFDNFPVRAPESRSYPLMSILYKPREHEGRSNPTRCAEAFLYSSPIATPARGATRDDLSAGTSSYTW